MNSEPSVTVSDRGSSDGVTRSRHVGSAIVLLGLAVPASLFLTFWTTAPPPVVGVILWAAGLGLLTGTTIGFWLGRLGASVLLLAAAYVAWNVVIWYFTLEGTWKALNIVLFAGLSALLLGAGSGVWVALRPRADERQP